MQNSQGGQCDRYLQFEHEGGLGFGPSDRSVSVHVSSEAGLHRRSIHAPPRRPEPSQQWHHEGFQEEKEERQLQQLETAVIDWINSQTNKEDRPPQVLAGRSCVDKYSSLERKTKVAHTERYGSKLIIDMYDNQIVVSYLGTMIVMKIK